MARHEDAAAVDAGGNDLALGAARFLGEPADILRADGDLALRLGQRLAHLDGQKLRQRGLVVHQRVVQLPQKADAGHQVHARKLREGRRAASMARIVSASPQAGTVPMTSPVAGFVTSIVLPLSAAIQSPATKFACFIQLLPVCHDPLPFVRACASNPPFRIRHGPLQAPPAFPRLTQTVMRKRGSQTPVCSMHLARRNWICCGAACPSFCVMAWTAPRPEVSGVH
jgi:hypothetical protein